MTTIKGTVIAITPPIPYEYSKINGNNAILSLIKMVVKAKETHMLTFFAGPNYTNICRSCNVEAIPIFLRVAMTQVGDEIEISFNGSKADMWNISMYNFTKAF